ncbi:LacI family DNA-binding transcriptional regulator [Vibrio astriarenae]|uniref:LacI family DNA-binding transcriptional regulator n=1 Tax=Vibrio astriarenae TaxID=1481923 RepID=UPI003736893C
MKKATVYDVAKSAGVSVSTVSRYLNRTSYIVKQKVDLIERAMAELDFHPKTTKTSSISKRNMVLGVVTPTFDSPFTSAIIGGIYIEITNSAYRLEIEATQWTPSRERKLIIQMLRQKVDGLVLIVPSLSVEEIKKLTGDLPVVIVGKSGGNLFKSLTVDNQLGGYIATNHLIQLGHKNIVHAFGTRTSHDSLQRHIGYKTSLKAAGIEYDNNLVIEGGYESQMSFDSMIELIDKDVKFTAVFASNDNSAFGIIQALYQRDLKVPSDVSVIGFDDLLVSRFFVPTLTTIKQPLGDLGQLSIKSILDLISHNSSDYVVPPATLIERESTSRVGT